MRNVQCTVYKLQINRDSILPSVGELQYKLKMNRRGGIDKETKRFAQLVPRWLSAYLPPVVELQYNLQMNRRGGILPNVINDHDSTRHRDKRKLMRGFHGKLRIQSKQIGVLQGRHCPFRGKMWVETRHIKHRHPVAGAMWYAEIIRN